MVNWWIAVIRSVWWPDCIVQWRARAEEPGLRQDSGREARGARGCQRQGHQLDRVQGNVTQYRWRYLLIIPFFANLEPDPDPTLTYKLATKQKFHYFIYKPISLTNKLNLLNQHLKNFSLDKFFVTFLKFCFWIFVVHTMGRIRIRLFRIRTDGSVTLYVFKLHLYFISSVITSK